MKTNQHKTQVGVKRLEVRARGTQSYATREALLAKK